MQRLLALALLLCASLTPFAICVDARAQQNPAIEIPKLWGAEERFERIDVSTYDRIRFLTTTDNPPMNFVDRTGRLSGFNIDLVRAICEELDITDLCEIQALPFDDLVPALEAGEGEAIIAGLQADEGGRGSLAFSRPYLLQPARFVTRRQSGLTAPSALDGQRVGVLGGSAHEAMLRRFFPDLSVTTYARESWMLQDLADGRIGAVFGDGQRLSGWLGGEGSDGCCVFSGGPYLSGALLGQGYTIAVDESDPQLAEAFDGALRALSEKGRFGELYLRYFPVSFY